MEDSELKKILMILLCMTLFMPSIVFASKFSEEEVVELVDGKDGSKDEYVVVNLLLDGDDVLSDVPAILYTIDGATRTLVPISFIIEKVGADIEWNGDTKEVTINYNGKIILLKIDSNTALVDGVTYDLPNQVPAKLMAHQGTYRTMVPVNFIAQHLGYDIFWKGETRTVSINKPQQTLTGMRYVEDDEYPELRFKVTGEVSMTSFSVDGRSVGSKDSLVLDFHNTKLDLDNPPKYGKYIINDMIQEIFDVSIEQSSTAPYTSKAVVGLGYFRNGDISFDASTNEMIVQLINSVNYVDYEETNGVTSVIVSTTANPAYNVTMSGQTVYVDVIHSKLRYGDDTLAVNTGGIDHVNYRQIDDSTLYDQGTRFTRVEVKLEDNVSTDQVLVEHIGSKVYVYVADKGIGTYSYVKDIENASSEFAINLLAPGNYTASYQMSDHSLTYILPIDDVNLTTGTDKRDDGVIDQIVVTESTSEYKVKVYLADETSYSSNDSNQRLSLSFVNEKLKDSKYKDTIIVVDAGHGGHDPGAVSSNSTKEKDIVLKASLELKRKLENEGFKVYLTRERDNYVKLYDRAGVANQLNADLFISVHANAARNTKANGIEVLYAPDSSRNNKEFARAVQDELIKQTNAVDRGIVSRPELVVIRETEMDAILVEIGFLTNSSEEIRLLSNAYIENCANSIVDGVKNFLD